MLLKAYCLFAGPAQKKLWAKKNSRSKVCYFILSAIYCVIFLIQLTDFACQQHSGVNIDHKNKTKNIATYCSGFFYSFLIVVLVMEVERDTDGAILRICIILAQNHLLSFEIPKHGNTVVLIC